MVRRLVKVLLVLALVALVGLKFLPLGASTVFQSVDTGKNFTVPNLVVPAGECCAYAATFKSIRSVWSLEREVEKILEDDYEEMVCSRGDRVYYDVEQNVTVTGYTVRLGFPFNEVIISYELGKKC